MNTNSDWEQRLQRQQDLEEFAHLSGQERFERRLVTAQEGGRGSTAGAARRLLAEAVEPTEAAIAWAVEESSKKRGRKPVALRWAKELGYDVAAFLTARVVLDGIHTGKQDAKTVARHISRLALHELRYRRFREEAPGLFHYRMNNFDTSSYAHRSRSLNAAMSYAEVDVSDLDMSPRDRILVGIWFVDKLAQATGLIELENETVRDAGGKAMNRLWIVPAEGTLEWMAQRNEVLADLQPVKLPTLVPARPWKPNDRGGYRFKLRGAFPLVRGFNQQAEAVEGRDMPVVYDAINRLQDTAWRVNTDVLAIVQEIERRGGGLCGVPRQDLEPEPALWDTYTAMRAEGALGDVKILDGDPEGPEDQVKALLRAHRYALGQVKERNHYAKLEQIAHSRLMRVGERFADEEVFYYPYNMDFRGRIYPIVDYLSPQGPDIEKALLTFADKRPIGALGGKWLAIHLTGSMGVTPGGTRVSTMTLIERQVWVEDNEERVLQVARDPWADLWWTDADDPLQFFAACCEWSRWEEAGYSGDYLCGLPVAMDGSCNGLQHFAAMFRDEVGAVAVNVSPNARPRDVYSLVAERVLDLLEAEAFDNPLAKLWLTSGLVDRELTKRPTMTFGYGSKVFGFTSQITEYLQKDTDWETTEAHFSVLNEETGEMESVVFEARS